MEKFNRLIGVAAPFPVVNVDTDMIIPKDYMKTITRSGLGVGLFAELRYDDDGSPAPAFVLNKPRYRNAVILIVGANFGCGSSREHAPWALLDFGIRCLISTSFADIFYNNCFKNGILPIVVDTSLHSKLMNDASKRDGVISVDLEQQVIRAIDGSCHCFEIDGSRRETLLHG
jgi:3-isopropylmalate/(R)-2-methylmalate dehydratase small subunit